MPILLTTNIPENYIGEANLKLPVGGKNITIHSRYTVFGELLSYKCLETELPEAALRLTFSWSELNFIKAEFAYLPYRLLIMAFESKKKYDNKNPWQGVKNNLISLRQGKDLYKLKHTPQSDIAREIVDYQMSPETRGRMLKPFMLLYEFNIGNIEKRIKVMQEFYDVEITPLLPVIIESLNSSNENLTTEAIFALGNSGDIRATPLLLNLLRDTNERISMYAASALGTLNDRESVVPLLNLMNDPEQDRVSTFAAFALTKLKSIHGIRFIINRLKDYKHPIYSQIIDELIYLTTLDNNFQLLLKYNPGEEENVTRDAICNMIVRGIEQAYPVLITALGEKDSLVSHSILKLFQTYNITTAIPAIAECLNGSEYLQFEASYTLAMMGDDRGYVNLVSVFKRNDWYYKGQAAEGIVALGKKDNYAVLLLIKCLKHRDYIIRTSAARALSAFRDERAIVPYIEYIIKNPDNSFPSIIAEALKAIGKPAAKELMAAFMNFKTQNIADLNSKIHLARTISILWNYYSVKELLTLMENEDKTVVFYLIQALSKPGKNAVATIIKLMRHRTHPARCHAAGELQRLADKRAIGPLIALLSDSDERMRSQAARSLFFFADKSAFEPLLPLLEDKDAWVRASAIETLCQSDGDRAIGPALKMLKDKSYDVRLSTVRALMKLNRPETAPHLVKLLNDKSKEVADYAAIALGKLGDDRGLDRLIFAIKKRPFYDFMCEEAIVKLGSKAVSPVINLLDSYDYTVRQTSVKLLGEIGDSRAIEPLRKKLETETIISCRTAIEEALQKLTNS